MALRVIHQPRRGSLSRDQLTEYAARLRSVAGVLESEAFASIDDETECVVAQVWEGEEAFSAYWEEQLKHPDEPFTRAVLAGAVDSEFYTQQRFYRDRIWLAESVRGRTPRIVWPSRGPVRIVITLDNDDLEGSLPRLRANAAGTRLEPGCEHFGWYRGTEHERSVLLLEKWADQFVYDTHWHLRIKTTEAPPADAPPPPPRAYGERSFEFYRWQGFVHLYDRWLPADVHERGETLAWPD